MPLHKTTMTIEHGSIELQKASEKVKFVLRADGEKIGELTILAASVQFKGRNQRSSKKWSMTQFVKLLEDNS
ncbi:MAG: hypothetical protein ACK6DC_20185 [Planctomycetota bacterium]|jgi:hypothetical protein